MHECPPNLPSKHFTSLPQSCGLSLCCSLQVTAYCPSFEAMLDTFRDMVSQSHENALCPMLLLRSAAAYLRAVMDEFNLRAVITMTQAQHPALARSPHFWDRTVL